MKFEVISLLGDDVRINGIMFYGEQEKEFAEKYKKLVYEYDDPVVAEAVLRMVAEGNALNPENLCKHLKIPLAEAEKVVKHFNNNAGSMGHNIECLPYLVSGESVFEKPYTFWDDKSKLNEGSMINMLMKIRRATDVKYFKNFLVDRDKRKDLATNVEKSINEIKKKEKAFLSQLLGLPSGNSIIEYCSFASFDSTLANIGVVAEMRYKTPQEAVAGGFDKALVYPKPFQGEAFPVYLEIKLNSLFTGVRECVVSSENFMRDVTGKPLDYQRDGKLKLETLARDIKPFMH